MSADARGASNLAPLLAEARAWQAQDPDPATRAELDALIAQAEAGDADLLAERFDGRLQFGTAGLRAALGAGPTRMNRVVVGQAAHGLAAYLLARHESPSVVVGYDGRTNSRVFARDTVELMAGAGVRALLLPRLLPTPVLAFAVRALGVDAGVMVTASHNPAADNGYKVYLGGADAGSQIVPPADAEIHAEIVRAASMPLGEYTRSQAWALVTDSIVDDYVEATAAVAAHANERLRYVYTAMHGVGWEVASRTLVAAGFAPPHPVAAQQEPDPAFPTVAFPNPEEPGALDLAFAEARAVGADLVIANDPDADRLAVGVPDPSADGGWRRLSGNELGWLLGWRAARRLEAVTDPASATGARRALACSLVSSPALAAVAGAYGLDHAETLTGFKWISRVPGLVYGYEEALGYLVNPDTVRDKDGISAAVAVLDLASELADDGRTLAGMLVEFAERFGGFASGQVSLRMREVAEIPRLMASLRAEPPGEFAGVAIERVDDFLSGVDGFERGDVLRYRLADGSRVIVRPSGTEPKLKVYLDAASHAGDGTARLAAAAASVAALDAAVRELLAAR